MWYFARIIFLFGFMLNLSWKLSLFTAMGLPIILVIPKISGKFHQVRGFDAKFYVQCVLVEKYQRETMGCTSHTVYQDQNKLLSCIITLMCILFLLQALSKKVQESLAKANHVATETFSSIKTVRSFANEEGETERYKKSLEDTYALNKKEAAAYAASTWTNSVSLRLQGYFIFSLNKYKRYTVGVFVCVCMRVKGTCMLHYKKY